MIIDHPSSPRSKRCKCYILCRVRSEGNGHSEKKMHPGGGGGEGRYGQIGKGHFLWSLVQVTIGGDWGLGGKKAVYFCCIFVDILHTSVCDTYILILSSQISITISYTCFFTDIHLVPPKFLNLPDFFLLYFPHFRRKRRSGVSPNTDASVLVQRFMWSQMRGRYNSTITFSRGRTTICWRHLIGGMIRSTWCLSAM